MKLDKFNQIYMKIIAEQANKSKKHIVKEQDETINPEIDALIKVGFKESNNPEEKGSYVIPLEELENDSQYALYITNMPYEDDNSWSISIFDTSIPIDETPYDNNGLDLTADNSTLREAVDEAINEVNDRLDDENYSDKEDIYSYVYQILSDLDQELG